jgi:ATP-binding cassette subfamily F protein 3
MHSCDLLIDALHKYQGSIILVSHDRYFVSKTANKIWEIVDHKVKEFKGGYDEWVAWKERMARQAKMEASNQKAEVNPSTSLRMSERTNEVKKTSGLNVNNQKSVTRPDSSNTQSTASNFKPQTTAAPINKETKKELQKQQRIFQQLEEQIAALNTKRTALETSLSDPATYSDKNKFLQAETDYKKATEELERLNAQYEKTFELIVSLEGK